jgi:hypothetical protein
MHTTIQYLRLPFAEREEISLDLAQKMELGIYEIDAK